MTNAIEEIADAQCLLVIGSNTTVAHPVLALQIKRAVSKGAKLIVANPREIDLCRYADLHLQLIPGTDVPLVMGMVKTILDEGLWNREFVAERCEDFAQLEESLRSFGMAEASQITGVPIELIQQAARLYATSEPSSILYTLGITQHTHGTDNVFALANLAMATGQIGKHASGVNPLRGANNVQGACDMGSLPPFFPAYQQVADPGVREKFSKAWGVSLSDEQGLTIEEMVQAAHEGSLKAVYVMGENPALSDPDVNHVRAAFGKLEFLVVQDIFLTETAQLADIVLPAATFAEKEGTFTNTERRVQRVRQAIAPVGEARQDWAIISE
ncbi:MAG: formate dehydrogenase subunit alpha, partial [Chloroflexota bacterium]